MCWLVPFLSSLEIPGDVHWPTQNAEGKNTRFNFWSTMETKRCITVFSNICFYTFAVSMCSTTSILMCAYASICLSLVSWSDGGNWIKTASSRRVHSECMQNLQFIVSIFELNAIRVHAFPSAAASSEYFSLFKCFLVRTCIAQRAVRGHSSCRKCNSIFKAKRSLLQLHETDFPLSAAMRTYL